jgi:hypothetical protein
LEYSKQKITFANKRLRKMEQIKTKEQALQWLKEVKQNKQRNIERLTKIAVEEYEKRTGLKATHIETL